MRKINIVIIKVFLLLILFLFSNYPIDIFADSLEDIRWVVMCETRFDYDLEAFQRLKAIGVQAVLDAVPWFDFEPTEGTFDFSDADNHYNLCKQAGLVWIPQIAIQYVPQWLYNKDVNFHWILKDGTIAPEVAPPNFFHPDTLTYVDKAINAFTDHFKNADIPLIYIATGQWGESFYPDDANFAAFDPYTIAAWRSYTKNPNAIPYSHYGDTEGRGGTLEEFLTFWYQKMYDFIAHTHGLIHSKLPNSGLALKVTYYTWYGRYADKQTEAALPYNLKVISFGGPISNVAGTNTLAKVARDYGLLGWEESYFYPFNNSTNSVIETKNKLVTNNIKGYIHGNILALINTIWGSPPGEPKEEFYRYKKLIEECEYGFETWGTNFWIAQTTGSANYAVKNDFRKEGNYTLYLSCGTSGGSATVYHDTLYNVTNDAIVYEGGDVVLDAWRYLIQCNGLSSLYWVIEGYNEADEIKMHAVYWAGSSNSEQETSFNNGCYYLKMQLENNNATGEWIKTVRVVNKDIDCQFGEGTWNNLGIKKIRIVNKVSGYALCEGFVDEVKLTNTLPYGIDTDFEEGVTAYWNKSGSGYEVSKLQAKSGSQSLHLTHLQGDPDIRLYQDYVYPGGPVILKTWRFLVNSTSSSSAYFKILGYGADESLKFKGVYWFGSSEPTWEDSCSLKVQLSNSSQTGQWINDIRIVNMDYGQNAWNNLGIIKLRFMICAGGNGSTEVYIDDVQLKINGPSIWYLAEGCVSGFDEWLCIQNPSNDTADVSITLMQDDGKIVTVNDTLVPTSRKTVKVNNCFVQGSVSAKVECTNGVNIITERAMYWYAGTSEWEGGHCSRGVTETAPKWYLAEGCTAGSFDEWVLIQNPNSTPTKCKATFMKSDGNTVVHYIDVPATTRRTIHVNEHVPNESVSTMVESTDGAGIIVERAMYWDAGGIKWSGGHCSEGVTSPATTWYLAEGTTLGSFDEWVLIQNPNNAPAQCKVTFMKSGGSTVVHYIDVPATARRTIHVNEHVPNESVSTKVESTNGVEIIVERAMYWDAGGIEWDGGHCSEGVTSPATTWYLAEGATLGSFDEWVLIQNPNNAPAQCLVTFMKEDGSTIERNITIGATSRYTIYVNNIVPNTSVSTMVKSTNGVEIIVERAMYWDANGKEWADGHCSTGVVL